MADRSRGPRLGKRWQFLEQLSVGLNANATFAGGSLPGLEPFTVLRMLGEYIIGVDAAPTIADSCQVGVGIGVVSIDSVVLGSTAMPDPIGEPDFPWLYWAVHKFHYASVITDPAAATGSIWKTFDVRSMRKFKPRESLVAVVEYLDGAGTPAMQFEMARTRVLIGLH